MELRIEKPVTVIIPSIGQPYLKQAVDSVLKQSHKNLKCLIVVDGPMFLDKVADLHLPMDERIQVTVAPENTGANGFYGHRIYAGYPHLINSDFIAFLDEDNWFEEDHIKSLVDLIDKKNFDWAHSFRNIYKEDGHFVTQDCCESLGVWPIHWSLGNGENGTEHLVDTSSYCFKRDFLIKVCNHWHHGWGGDRRFYHILTRMIGHKNFGCTNQHTLNYRLDANVNKKYGDIGFFEQGNAKVKDFYGGKYPWQD